MLKTENFEYKDLKDNQIVFPEIYNPNIFIFNRFGQWEMELHLSGGLGPNLLKNGERNPILVRLKTSYLTTRNQYIYCILGIKLTQILKQNIWTEDEIISTISEPIEILKNEDIQKLEEEKTILTIENHSKKNSKVYIHKIHRFTILEVFWRAINHRQFNEMIKNKTLTAKEINQLSKDLLKIPSKDLFNQEIPLLFDYQKLMKDLELYYASWDTLPTLPDVG